MSEADKPLIRILLIDTHAIVRAGLRLLLESRPGFQVIGDVGHIGEAIVVARRDRPDIILFEAAVEVADLSEGRSADSLVHAKPAPPGGSPTDGKPTHRHQAATRQAASELAPSRLLSLQSAAFQESGAASDGVDFIPDFLEAAPEAKVIVLTGSTNAQLHRRIVAQGAKGLLQKDCSPEILMRAIERVHAGEVWIERAMMASVLAEISQSGRTPDMSAAASLTVRERQVIALLCEGMPNRQIASHLAISETTVRRHLTSIFAKVGVADRLELVIYAYRHNLVDIIET